MRSTFLRLTSRQPLSILAMERYLLLRDSSVCAVTKHSENEGSTLITISPSGHFVDIYHFGQRFRHLTRRFQTASVGSERSAKLLCEDRHMSVHICNLSQRIYAIRKYYAVIEDNCIEQRLQDVGGNNVRQVEVVTAHPMRRVPADVQSCILDTALRLQTDGRHRPTDRTITTAGEWKDSAQTAAELLDRLMTNLTPLGVDPARYLAPHAHAEQPLTQAFSTLTMVESVDGDVFTVSHDGRTTPRSSHEERARQVFAQALQVVCQQVGVEQAGMEMLAETEWASAELEVEAWLRGRENSPVSGDIILRLRSDYFTFVYRNEQGDLIRKSLHTSLLQYELERQAHMLEVGDDSQVVWTDNVHEEPLPEEGAMRLLGVYHQQALRLLRYRDHVVQQSRGLEYVYTPQRTPNPSSTSLQPSTPHHQRRELAVSPAHSCHTVSRGLPDGTHLTAVMKLCQGREDAAPYLLSLANVPVNPHFDIGGRPAPAHLLDSRAYPGHSVTQINATFPDHTIIKFDLKTQIFNVVLGRGEECSFTLGSFKREEGIFASQAHIPMINNAFYDPRPVEARYVQGMRCRPPIRGELDAGLLAQYVRRILAFHRWADTPAHLRAALEEHDARQALLVRAAALKAHQQLMKDRILAGQLSAKQARELTAQYVAKLDASDRAPLATTPPTPALRAGAGVYSPQKVPRTPARPGAALNSVTRVVSTGSSLTSPVVSSSTLSYSPLSSPASASAAGQTLRQMDNVVTPEDGTPNDGLRFLQAHADRAAGEYLHHNLRIHSTRLEKHLATVVTPEAGSFPAPAPRFDIYKTPIPHERDEFPDYNHTLDVARGRYLSIMYVQDALNTSAKMLEQGRGSKV